VIKEDTYLWNKKNAHYRMCDFGFLLILGGLGPFEIPIVKLLESNVIFSSIFFP